MLEEALTQNKNSLKTTEIITKHYEETIKTVQKELEETLTQLREKTWEMKR